MNGLAWFWLGAFSGFAAAVGALFGATIYWTKRQRESSPASPERSAGGSGGVPSATTPSRVAYPPKFSRN